MWKCLRLLSNSEQQCQSSRETSGPRESTGEPQFPAGVSVRVGNRSGVASEPRTDGGWSRPQSSCPADDGDHSFRVRTLFKNK